MPENQTAWNSNNQGIKETVNQPRQTGRVADRENLQQGDGPSGWGSLRETVARQRTVQARLAERETGTQSWLWTVTRAATMGEAVKQNHQTHKAEDREKPRQGSRLWRRGWLKGKLRLRADCGLWQLPQWEKLPVSQERVHWKVS